jgi:hypothetical protein
VNPCLNENVCGEDQICVDVGDGTFYCHCKYGYYGNGTTCFEVPSVPDVSYIRASSVSEWVVLIVSVCLFVIVIPIISLVIWRKAKHSSQPYQPMAPTDEEELIAAKPRSSADEADS